MNLNDETDDLRNAVVQAADLIEPRPGIGTILESAVRDALVEGLEEAEPEVRLKIDAWLGRLGGVDVIYRPSPTRPRLGIEAKVWDVSDSLFDVLKLAAATRQELLAAGFIVAAGRSKDWQAPSVIKVMSECERGRLHPWTTLDVLKRPDSHWQRIWSRSSARPQAVPAEFQTWTAEPVPMPRVPDHEIRIIGVRAVGTDRIAIAEDGKAGGSWDETLREEATRLANDPVDREEAARLVDG